MNRFAVSFKNAFLLTAAVVLSNFSLDATKAYSQTTYTLDANYDITSQLELINDDKFTITVSGTSTDAPFGLNTLSDFVYSQINPTTGVYRFNNNPEVFGLQNRPTVPFTLGSGTNKLFGTSDVNGVINIQNLTEQGSGIFTITGGEGLFQGATGQLKYFGTSTVSFDPNTPNRTKVNLAGTFTASQKIPESNTNMALIAISLAASCYGIKKYKRKYST